MRALAEGVGAWAIPWPCVHEFIGKTTNPRIFKRPSTLAQAFDQLRAWAESTSFQFLGERPAHMEQLYDLMHASRLAGPAVHDARIAAICLQHGVSELWTADRDFSRFPSLKTRNPLVAG